MPIKRVAFTIPTADLELIQKLKVSYMKQGIEMNKSEIVRAGLHALANIDDKQRSQLASEMPRLKVGRPAQPEKPD